MKKEHYWSPETFFNSVRKGSRKNELYGADLNIKLQRSAILIILSVSNWFAVQVAFCSILEIQWRGLRFGNFSNRRKKEKGKQFPRTRLFMRDTKYNVHNRPSISSTFVSVDKKLNITVDVNTDLFIRFGPPEMKFYDVTERVPVLCATHSAYLSGCLPRLLRKYTLCFLDFNWKNLFLCNGSICS